MPTRTEATDTPADPKRPAATIDGTGGRGPGRNGMAATRGDSPPLADAPHALPLRVLGRALRSFHPSSMPRMSRRNYALELRAALFLPFLLVVVDSSIVGVIVKNAYEGVVSAALLNQAVAILSASTAAANIVSFIWVKLSNGLNKIAFINGLQVSMIALCVLIGFAPRTTLGLWGVVAAVIAGRLCWAGFLTLRSTIWSANYGPHVRARITGKLATIQVLMVAGLGLALGKALNLFPDADRWFYPIGGALSLVGVWAWAGVRVRGHRALLSAEKARTGSDAPTFSPLGVVRVLKADPLYARYMLAMFLLGLGNLMTTPLVVIVVRDQFRMEYLGGIAITTAIPMLFMPLMIPVWARLLDRFHVVQFRAVHSWAFVSATWVTYLAVQFDSEALLYVAAILMGLGFAGGVLAWNLGHLDFAPKGMESQYMGVHATLNGVRGIMAPFIGVGLYQILDGADPSLNLGAYVFALCTILTLAGGLGFLHLARSMPAGGWRRQQPVETTPPARAAGS